MNVLRRIAVAALALAYAAGFALPYTPPWRLLSLWWPIRLAIRSARPAEICMHDDCRYFGAALLSLLQTFLQAHKVLPTP